MAKLSINRLNKMVVIFFPDYVVLGNDGFLKILHITCNYDIISYIKGSIYLEKLTNKMEVNFQVTY